MLAEIITIGDEILIGQVIDTNSAWIAEQLNSIGIRVCQITSVTDEKEHIQSAVEAASARAQLIITTGGLGPTRDDITKRTLADYFKTPLVMNAEVLAHVEQLFANRGVQMPEVNRYQALVPESCEVIMNPNGTAPGMWFNFKDNRALVSMPGVPYEMKYMVSEVLLEKWRKHFNTPAVYHRTVLTQGVGESSLMGMIDKWEDSLQEEQLKLAYLPSPGVVRLRISGVGESAEVVKTRINKKVSELEELIPELIFGYEKQTLEEVVGNLLNKNGATVATAESCTGGYIAHLITRIPGSSAYFKGSVVAYANEVKEKELNVPLEQLEAHGAVSEPVVRAMAEGVREKLGTTFGVATSGIAGPDGGTEEKPVGLVWMAVAGPNGTITAHEMFGNNRERNIRKATLFVLNLLRKEILKPS